MPADSAESIEAWFEGHDDGEFAIGSVEAGTYSVRAPFGDMPVILGTKIHPLAMGAGFGLIVRYGLPSRADIGWMREVVGQK